jgi:3-hydroxyisobutyrate dehydrogenase-like beta-hydroxyacid dehydrogenase
MKLLTADQTKLGFIGLGNMGSRIAKRLLDHGYQLSVYDLDVAKAQALAARGGIIAKNVIELARTVDVLLTCLTNDEAVESVFTGPEGIFAGARPGTIVLEMSTISPETSRELHTIGARSGVEVMDVAISGSTPAAEDGALTLLVGGNRELFRAAKPIFQTVAKQFHLLGGPGSGTTMKLVVNTLLGVGMQAIAEAVVLGEKAGLDRERLLEVLSKDSRHRTRTCGEVGEGGNQRLQPAISPTADEQRLPADSESGGTTVGLHAGDRSGISCQFR